MTKNNKTRSILLLVLSVLLLSGDLSAISESSESDQALDSLEQKLIWVHHRLELERYNLAVNNHSDSLAFFEGLFTALLVGIDSSWANHESDAKTATSSNRLRRLLGQRGVAIQIEQSRSVSSLRDSLAVLLGGISPFKSSVISREENFRQQCAQGIGAKEILRDLLKERNRLARRAGYTNYYSLNASLSGFTVDELRDLFDNALRSSEAAYASELARKRNSAKPELWNVGVGAAQARAKFDTFFPADSHLDKIKEMLSLIGFDINALPLFIESTNGRGDLYQVSPPSDIRIIVSSTDGLAGFERTAELLSGGLAASMLDKGRGLHGILREQPWEIAMKRLLVRLYRLPESLTRLSGMSAGGIRAFTDASKRQDIIDARKRLLESEFEYQLYKNSDQNISKLYWQLCDKLLGVKIHDDIDAWKVSAGALIRPLSSVDELLGEIAAEQIVSTLSGRFTDPTTDSGSSAFLTQNFFRFGSRYPWLELLRRGTDEDINPDHLLKQN